MEIETALCELIQDTWDKMTSRDSQHQRSPRTPKQDRLAASAKHEGRNQKDALLTREPYSHIDLTFRLGARGEGMPFKNLKPGSNIHPYFRTNSSVALTAFTDMSDGVAKIKAE
jgi:hypothetical protein